VRTTLDIDGTVLAQLRERQRREEKTLGQLVSELLATALAAGAEAPSATLVWRSQAMGARVDLEDRDELANLVDG